MANQATTTSGNSRIVTALFKDRESADCAYSALNKRGYDKDSINVMMSDETRKKYYPEGSAAADTELGTKAWEGTGTGASIGGTVGAVLGAIAAIGTSIALPGLGLLIAGPIAGALVGAGAGGLTGGLIGALVGSGIPEETAKEYESGIKAGGTVLGVHPRTDDDAQYFEREWKSCGGVDVYSGGFKGAAAATTNAATATATTAASTAAQAGTVNRDINKGEAVIPVVEEELQVGKREVERGGVIVESRVTEKPVEANVNLREERVTVDRRPVDRPVTEGDVAAFKEGTIEVKEKAEQAVVSKQARVVEEVSVGKDVTERTETVRDTVRRTDVDVEKLGPGETRTTSATETTTRKNKA